MKGPERIKTSSSTTKKIGLGFYYEIILLCSCSFADDIFSI